MMLICLDGIDGAGKTTQVKLLQKYFLNRGYEVTVLKPFHFIRSALERFDGKLRRLINVLKQARIRDSGRSVYQNITKKNTVLISFVAMSVLIIIVVYLGLEKILNKIVYGMNTIVIYDRFYFDKLIPKNRAQYKLYYSILKQLIAKQCIILDIPTQIAYERMKDVHDKRMPKGYYDTLRRWYRVYAKLLGFPVIITSHSSPIETHATIISFIKNKIEGKNL